MRSRIALLSACVASGLSAATATKAQDAAALPASSPPASSEVIVTGRADQGYRVDTVPALGPLGERSVQDTPYSISIISADLAKNIGANTSDAVFRINPFVQLTSPSTRNGQTFLNIRGLSVSNKFEDNIRVSPYELIPIEDKEQIDILLGPSGFLYGHSDPGGAIDYVLKRPTPTRFLEATLGDYYGRAGVEGQIDAGGPIDDAGRLGLRLNLVGQTGDTNIPRQTENRGVASAALDVHLSPRFKLQADYSFNYDKLNGSPIAFNFDPLPNHAPPAADVLYSQPWIFSSYETNRGAVRLDGDLNDTFRLRTAISYSVSNDTFTTFQAASVNTATTQYLPFAGVNPPVELDNLGGYGYIDARFQTLGVKHVVTFGFNANRTELDEGPNFRQVCLSPLATIGFANCTPASSSPFSIKGGVPVIPYPGDAAVFANYDQGSFKNSVSRNVAELIGDDITLRPWAELLVGVSHVDLQDANYNAAGAITRNYDKDAYNPNASLILKPFPWLSGYFTYAQGLEDGTIVGPGFTNTGQVLAPNRTEQYEVGAKGQLNGALLTLALFELDRPNQFSNLAAPLPTFVSDGNQRDRGIELSATGKILPRLAIVGGATFLDAEVQGSNTPAVIGKRPVGVADTLAKIYLDYELPFTSGLFLSGGVNYTGDFANDALNTVILPSVTTFDLGGRLERVLWGRATTFRVYASNITNKSYFLSNAFEGDPARVSFSVSSRF